MRQPAPAATVARRAVAALLALLVVLLPAAPAWGHATLIDTLPADGTLLETDPAEVVLRFSEPVGTALGTVEVLAPDGTRVDDGEVERLDDGRTLSTSLEPDLPHGTFTVLWRVVSGDSHPISGASTFSVGHESATADVAAHTDEHTGAAGDLLTAARFVLYAGLVLLVGGLAFLLVLWPAGWSDRRSRRIVWAGWAATAAASAAGLLLQGPYASGQPLTSALDPALLRDVLSTRFGVASGFRLLLLVATAGLLLRLVQLRRSPVAVTAAAVLGASLLITTSAVGHAAAGAWSAVALPADVLHLAAMSVWLGGLVLLGAVLLRRHPTDLADVLPRWSSCAAMAVVVLVVTGAFASWREVGELGALTATSYGRSLLVKLALVLGMLLLAAAGRSWVRRHHSLPVVHAAGPATRAVASDVRPAPAAADVSRLRRWVLLEAATAVAVLAVTAVLVESTPARVAYAPVFDDTAVVTTGELQARVVVAPAKAGLNDLRVRYTDLDGQPVDVPEAAARWTLPGSDDVVPVELTRTAPGRYERLRVAVPAPGTWHLTLTTRTSDIDATSTRFTVRVR